VSGCRRARWCVPVREIRADTVLFVNELRVDGADRAAVEAELAALRKAVDELAELVRR
jgi:hypothetical protein